ncbi:MAG: Ppx/GppA family phosphatase [Nitrospinae bacterium]|nr:Ppx/GppA family phosphatase [Nitrospinota bacterium]
MEKENGNTGRYASIDVGSNTVRLLVARAEGGGFRELHSSQIITRLAEKAHDTGLLSETAMERTLAGLEGLVAGAGGLRPFRVCATATHAVRKAKNGGEFAERFKKRLGFPINVIEWEKEAGLSLKGAEMVVGAGKPILLFDVGGGSTEFIHKGADGSVRAVGTELGVVRLAETFIKSAPLMEGEYKKLAEYLAVEMSATAGRLKAEKPFVLVGTAGTITSIAAMIYNVHPYDPERVNNKRLLRKVVLELLNDVGGMTLEQRGRIPSLQNGREDLIIPGIGLTLAVMDAFGADELTVCDSGLREGILLSAMDGTIPSELLQ